MSWALLILEAPAWYRTSRGDGGSAGGPLGGIHAPIWGWWSRREGGFGSLAQVLALMQTPGSLSLAGWLHYLAFDLLVGALGCAGVATRRPAAPAGRADPVIDVPVRPDRLPDLAGGPGGVADRPDQARRRDLSRAQARVRPLSRVFVDLVRRRAQAHRGRGRLLRRAAAVPTAAAWAIDGRTLACANVWIKPLKFDVSVAIYLTTLAFFLRMTERRIPAVRGR